jgi:hypothetical protein
MSKRLPQFADLLPVFAVIATLFYGWSMVVFLWKLPGWMFFLNLGELAGILSYEFVTNLVESLFILFVLVLVCAILPPRFFRDVFVVRGSMAALVMIASMMLFLHQSVSAGPAFDNKLSVWMLVSLAIAVILSALATRLRWVGAVLAGLADRLIIFLFILMPLTALGLIIVIARYLM